MSRLTGPAWDACDGLEPEDVVTEDGVNVILDTQAEAFQGEHETEVWRTLSMDLAGRRVRDSTTMHSYGAVQARSTIARPSTGIPSATSGEPEHSSPHFHHDTGGQQLVV